MSKSQWRFTDLVNTVYPVGNFSGGAFPANVKNMFQVRRGRVKVVYDNVVTQFVLQFDAIQTGFTTKDAYSLVTEPWIKSFGLQMGVSIGRLAMRSLILQAAAKLRNGPACTRLFSRCERELGAKLFYAPPSGPLSFLRVDVGVFNGSGPTANEYDSEKDIIGHVAVQLPFDAIGAALDFGVSGYFGSVRNNTKFLYTMGTLANGNPGYATLDGHESELHRWAERTLALMRNSIWMCRRSVAPSCGASLFSENSRAHLLQPAVQRPSRRQAYINASLPVGTSITSRMSATGIKSW